MIDLKPLLLQLIISLLVCTSRYLKYFPQHFAHNLWHETSLQILSHLAQGISIMIFQCLNKFLWQKSNNLPVCPPYLTHCHKTILQLPAYDVKLTRRGHCTALAQGADGIKRSQAFPSNKFDSEINISALSTRLASSDNGCCDVGGDKKHTEDGTYRKGRNS